MKTLIAVAAALSFIATPVCDVSAKSLPKKQRYHAKRYYPRSAPPEMAYKPRRQQPGEWYEHIADKLPIGSAEWWEQMRREGRLGRSH